MKKLGARKWGRRDVRPRFDHGQPIAKIDTRPMVFVAFILVVLAILWASQIRTHAVLVDLPAGMGPPVDGPAPYATISVSNANTMLLDGDPVTLEEIPARLWENDYQIVLLRAEPDAGYDLIAKLIAAISNNGIAPGNICFDPIELSEHRMFGKASFQQTRVVIPEPGCEQFVPLIPSIT